MKAEKDIKVDSQKKPSLTVPFLVISAGVLVLVFGPILFGYLSAGDNHVFSGFLFNRYDNYSYYAKMRIGYEGSWLFRLPYSQEPGEGAFIFVFYIFLGHLTRWLHLSIPAMYQLGKFAAVVSLCWSMIRFIRRTFPGNEKLQNAAFMLGMQGAGLGWLFFMFTPEAPGDFWVAEAYPFLSAYANVHFPLGLALQLYLLSPIDPKTPPWRRQILPLLAGILLGLAAPFNLVVVGVVWLAAAVIDLIQKRHWQEAFRYLVWATSGGGLLVAWQYWQTVRHPVLAVWNSQNLTQTPPFYDVLISFSPALLLAVAGGYLLWKKHSGHRNLLPVWLAVCLILVYIPFSLQRRFLVGLFVPCALLAAWLVWEGIEWEKENRRSLIWTVIVVFSTLTNVVILASGLAAVVNRDANVFITRDENAVLEWLGENAEEDDLVLCSPEMGTLVPAYTTARVVYGHPFETVNAEEKEAEILSIFSGTDAPEKKEPAANLLVWGPREKALGGVINLETWTLVFESGEVQVYCLLGK